MSGTKGPRCPAKRGATGERGACPRARARRPALPSCGPPSCLLAWSSLPSPAAYPLLSAWPAFCFLARPGRCQNIVLKDPKHVEYAWCQDYLLTGGATGSDGSCCKADGAIYNGWCKQASGAAGWC